MKGPIRILFVGVVYISLSLAQSITITRPNGGESWTVGEKHPIHWDWTGNISSVKIEYSVDAGNNWMLVASSTQNDGDYLWTVPNMVSSNCFLKISDANDPSIYDISDESFSIARPIITIEKPNGGEVLRIGDYFPIQWRWTGKFNTVKIEYSTDGGSSWTTITNSTTNDGDFYWQIPNIPSPNYKIKITNNDDPNSFDISDNSFIVDTNTIKVITPNGGEAYITGKRYPITWDWTGSFNNVKIEYSIDGGNTWNSIISSTQNDGSHYWTVPNTPSNECRIRISDATNPNVTDTSDNNFSILSTGISIVSPKGGEEYYVGDKIPIHWNWTGDINNVKIEYSTDGGNNWNIITNSTQNNGKYLFTSPNTPSTQCKIKITNADDPNVFDISPSNFTIHRPVFEITRPCSTDSLIAGERYPIHWNYRGTSQGVKIELWYKTQTGVQWWTITQNTQNDGSYYFDVPYYITDSAGIKITNNDDPDSSFALSEVFRIVRPHIEVIYPNGGERLIEGHNMEIIWNTNGDIRNVMLQYSIDGGLNWRTITTSTQNDGSYLWSVPSGVYDSCIIKVVNTGDIDNFDVSDSAFHIIWDTIRIKRPNTGDVFYVGKKHPIYWESSYGSFEDASIYFSHDGGTTWRILTQNAANSEYTGYYVWQPDTNDITTNGRIMVVSNLNSGVYAISPPFTVQDSSALSGTRLLILSPSLGDTFYAGGTCVITWHSDTFSSPNQVDISYSINNGPWEQIATVANSSHSYEWSIPSITTQNCRIMVKDINGSASYISDSFVILPQEIEILSPSSIKKWVVGKKYFILWMYKGNFANATLDYSYDGGATWVTIASPTTNSGHYEWTVPNAPSKRCFLRIRNYENSSVYAISDSFSIEPQKIYITSPKKSDSLIIGRKYFITWDYTGDFSNVDIKYSPDGGTTWNDVVVSATNNQSYEWTIPNTPSDNALLEVINSANDSVIGISDTFHIVPQRITVYSPRLHDEWIIGRKYYIAWWNTGTFPHVKIDYSYDGGNSWNSITTSYNNQGTYLWTIPNTPSDNCLLKISNVDDTTVFDISDTFRIPLQTITITSPKSGDRLISGRKYYITWDWTGSFNNVDIEYSKDNGATWNLIQSGITNNGYYQWSVPTVNSDSCLIRIKNSQNSNVFNTSEMFSILPQGITITSPSSNDTLFGGRKYDITWRTKGSFSHANLEYSIDGGANWLVIASNITNNGHYEWTVPEVVSENALLRISNASQPSVYSLSDTFVIAQPIIEITSPLYGDNWFAGRKYYITWNNLGTISHINLYYSLDGGLNWSSIVLNNNNNGSYEWSIPSQASSQNSRIKLSSSANQQIYTESDSFTITVANIEEKDNIPDRFSIENTSSINAGNIVLKLSIPKKSNISIKLYDITGRTLFSASMKNLSPGFYSISPKHLSLKNGIYLIEFVAKGRNGHILFKQNKKLLKI